jgi:hypothetical protein
MSKDFREMRRQRQDQQQPQQGIAPVTPEDVYSVPLQSTVEPENRQTVSPPEIQDNQVVKTSFYPTQAHLDKLDDLAAEYNRRYRRQRRKIDRQDIIRFLIEGCTMNTLADLET